jgi:hypothetical protein
MPEDRPLFTYRLVLDELGGHGAVFAFGGNVDHDREVRLTIPREDWESIERLGDIEVDLRAARPPESV